MGKIEKLETLPPPQTHANCWSEPSALEVAMKVNEIIDYLEKVSEIIDYLKKINEDDRIYSWQDTGIRDTTDEILSTLFQPMSKPIVVTENEFTGKDKKKIEKVKIPDTNLVLGLEDTKGVRIEIKELGHKINEIIDYLDEIKKNEDTI